MGKRGAINIRIERKEEKEERGSAETVRESNRDRETETCLHVGCVASVDVWC